jgi:hypothetical protein
MIEAAGAGELNPEYDYTDDYVADDYPTAGSRPTDSEYPLGIAMQYASALLEMHVDELCTVFFNYPVLDCPTTTIYISVYIS